MRRTLVGVVVVLATAFAAAQQGSRGGEWTSYSGDPGSTKYAPLDQINGDNVTRLKVAWQRPSVDPSISSRAANFSLIEQLPRDAADDRRRPLQPERRRAGRGVSSGTGKTLWVQEPFSDEPGQGLRGDSARGLAYWSHGSDRRLFVVRGEYLIALDPRTGKPAADFGEQGRVNLQPGLGPRAIEYAWTGAPQVCRDVVIVGVGLGGSMLRSPMHKEAPPGSRAGVRRAHRQAALDVQPDPPPGRSRQRDVGERLLGVHRQREPVVADQRRRRAGACLSAADGADQRHVRRASARRQRVRQHAGVRQVPDRRTRLALPDRPPRSVGLRPADRADPRRHHGRRPADQSGRAAHETGVRVRLRSHDRQAGLADRRAAGAASDTPGERTAPTQPFPTKPPAFDRQGVTVDDLIDFTPELRAEAVELLKHYRIGPLFTPPTIRGDGPDGIRGHASAAGLGRAAPTGRAARSIRRRACCTCRRSPGPFTADIIKGDPKTSNLRYVSGTRAWTAGTAGPADLQAAVRPHHGDRSEQRRRRSWMVPNGEGPGIIRC